jgi:mRNA interferase YafQ
MWQPVYTKQFEKNVVRCLKRGYDMVLLKEAVTLLLTGTPLPEKYNSHKLHGNFAKHWECHIKPDWLLIYRYDENAAQLIFEATGTHSDLF